MANVHAYRSDPLLPGIYEAGVEYRREPPGNEQFKDVCAVLHDGYGDCEDLSCAVAAWRTVRNNELCTPVITWQPVRNAPPGHWLYHITVMRADGTREDPSRETGMNHEPGEWKREPNAGRVPDYVGDLWVYELFPGGHGVIPAPVPVRSKEEAA